MVASAQSTTTTKPRIRDLVWLDESIEVGLRFISKLSEIVLLLGVGYAGFKLAHKGPTPEILDQIWIISQIIALDLSAPGMFSYAKQAIEKGETTRATYAQVIGISLIVMSILSMVEGAIEYYLADLVPKDIITYASLGMVIIRCAAAVGYSVYCRYAKGETASTSLSIVPTSAPTSPTFSECMERIEQVEKAVEKLAEQVSRIVEYRLSTSSPTLITELPTSVSTSYIPEHVDSLHQPTLEPTLPTSVSTSDDSLQPDKVTTAAPQADRANLHQSVDKVYPVVAGVSDVKVKEVIDAFEGGTQWNKIKGNYSQTIKPIRLAYEYLHQPTSQI